MSVELSFRELLAREGPKLEEIAAEQQARRSDIPQRALVWCALAPFWTVELAQAAGFGDGEGKAERVLSRIQEEGLAESAPLHEPAERGAFLPPALRYWMTAPARAEVLQAVITDPERDLSYLVRELAVLGRGLLDSQTQVTGLFPEPLERWARLAALAEGTGDVADFLLSRIDEAFERKDPSYALRWIESARPLEEILGGELTAAIGLAGRRLELFHRRSEDERHLGRFLERREQIEAVRELLDGPDRLWALHLFGAGGVGKTMLVRYTTARLAPQLGVAAARIDFDFVNPEYPARAPGLLIAQLASELRLFDEGNEAVRLFRRFDDKVLRIHERKGSSLVGQSTPFSLGDPELQDVLETFARAARSLGRRVLLILDTCEELAKIGPGGAIPEAVSATFTLFELLHKALPSMRIIFCGRRPLASEGAGWECPASTAPARPYLRLHEIRGFLREQAERYLEQSGAPFHLHKVILERSPEVASLSPFRRKPAPDQISQNWIPPAGRERYNPFDLAFFVSWVAGDPEVTPQELADPSIDRYVSVRILGRIRDPRLRDLLLASALLGRFDRETLCAAVEMDASTFEPLYSALAGQEWIERQRSGFLVVDPRLRPRLLQHLRQTAPVTLEQVRRRAACHLEQLTLESPWSQLDISYFETLLGLLSGEPERASAWWAEVEVRLAREAAWDWALRLCEQILAAEASEESADAPSLLRDHLRAVVLATYAAALLHDPRRPRVDEQIWRELADTAAAHPLPEGTRRLERRALAGRIAASRWTGKPPDRAQVRSLWGILDRIEPSELDEQIVASCLAAVEAVVEWQEGEGQGGAPAPGPVLRLTDLAKSLKMSPALMAFCHSLVGRILALRGNPRAGEQQLMRALEAVPPKTEQTWLDWRAPDDLGARLELERIRMTYPAMLPPHGLLDRIEEELRRPTDLDVSRLDSAVIALRLAEGLIPHKQVTRLRRLVDVEEELAPREPQCRAHRAFPPLFVAVAEAMASVGEIDESLQLLQRRSRTSENSSSALDTVFDAERACLRLVRRLRLRDEGRLGLSTPLSESPLLEDRAMLWALEGFDGLKRREEVLMRWQEGCGPSKDQEPWFHQAWRTSYLLSPGLAAAILPLAAQVLRGLEGSGSSKAGFDGVSCQLDRVEADRVAQQIGQVSPFQDASARAAATVRGWLSAHRAQKTEALVLHLRCAALGVEVANGEADLARRIGYRRAAEMALDEGELLALRLPECSIPLLERARSWYRDARDYLGAFLADLCRATVLARLGQGNLLLETLHRIQKDCRALTSRSPGVHLDVKWVETAVRQLPRLDGLEDLPGSVWRPWLLRWAACLAWRQDGDRPGPKGHALATWLRSHVGAEMEGAITVPAELDWCFKLAEPQKIPPRSFSNEDARTRSSRLSSSSLKVLIRSSAPRTRPSIPESYRVFVSGLQPVALKCRLNAPYHSIAEQLTENRLPLSSRAADVYAWDLQLDLGACWIAWEAALTLALFEGLAVEPSHLLARSFCRAMLGGKIQPRSSLRIAHQAVTVAGTALEAESSARAWHAVRHQVAIGPLPSRGVLGAEVTILHLLGSPVATSSGVRLRFSAGADWERFSKAREGYGDLLSPEEILQKLPDLQAILVHAPPVDLFYRRSEEDREEAAQLRRLAAELSLHGVPIVLAVPRLPRTLSSQVLSALAEGLAADEGRSLEATVGRARHLIWVSALELEERDRLEIAFDLCLYRAVET